MLAHKMIPYRLGIGALASDFHAYDAVHVGKAIAVEFRHRLVR